MPLCHILNNTVKPLCFEVTTKSCLFCTSVSFTPQRSPHNGTLTSHKILSLLLEMSAIDASHGRGGSLAGVNTSNRKFSKYSKYWQTSECLFWLNYRNYRQTHYHWYLCHFIWESGVPRTMHKIIFARFFLNLSTLCGFYKEISWVLSTWVVVFLKRMVIFPAKMSGPRF